MIAEKGAKKMYRIFILPNLLRNYHILNMRFRSWLCLEKRLHIGTNNG